MRCALCGKSPAEKVAIIFCKVTQQNEHDDRGHTWRICCCATCICHEWNVMRSSRWLNITATTSHMLHSHITTA